jgi:hypothetical protein
LNFTDRSINTIKCKATRAFLESYKTGFTGKVCASGIIPFLRDASGDNKLIRTVSGTIAKEILVSYDEVVSVFEQEKGMQANFCDELNRLVIDGMKLK